MHPNKTLVDTFYAAFKAKDGDKMASCYHDDVVFTDPVFTYLEGKRAGNMWRMLCARAKDLEIEWSNIEVDDAGGSAHWEARYTFAKTGRKVHNIIDAKFQFVDGKIRVHEDRFNFWRWSRQALGPVGLLLGFTNAVRKKVQQQAMAGLDAFEAAQSK